MSAPRYSRAVLTDLLSRAMIVVLFTLLSINLFSDFMRTGHVTGLLLLVSELLVVLLTVVRRPAVVVDRAMSTRLVAAVSMLGIYFIRPVGTPLAPDLATATVSGAGLLAIIAAKLTLGRSFGLMPANRGIVRRGIYRVVRHPIYAGYLVTHAAFLIAHPTLWNCALIFTSDAALLVRAVFEERTLARDAEYADYMQQVRWRVLPGCF